MYVPNRELGEFLFDTRLISREELEHAASNLGESETLYAYLRNNPLVPEDELTRAAAHVLGVPFSSIFHDDIQEESLLLVPEPLARVHSFAAYSQKGNELHLLMLDLDALEQAAFLEQEKGVVLRPHLTDRASLKRALLIQQKLLKDRYANGFKGQDSEVVIDSLLSHALLSRAHEIHLTPRSSNIEVHYRIHGTLHPAMNLSTQVSHLLGKLKELGKLSFTLPLPQEGKFKLGLKNGERVRVRVATLPNTAGEKVTLHINREHTTTRGFTLDSLGFHGESLEKIHSLLAHPKGLILLAGPEGSGKTTCSYTLLDYLSASYHSIISVEEKIEMNVPHVVQTLVRRDLGQTTRAAIRSALAHNPDILAVGDLRDEDSIALVLSAAARGVSIIASIEAEDSLAAREKVLELSADTSALKATIGLRVVRKICPHCKEEYHLSRAEAQPIEKLADFGRVLVALKAEGVVDEQAQWKEILFARAVGCSRCKDGYQGFVGLQEVVLEGGGEIPLNIVEDGLFKAAQGLTSIEEVHGLAI